MHYVIGDIHCQIGTLKRLLDKLELKPEDEVYFVGDWFDREYCSEDRFKTYDWMVENLVSGSQFKSVFGNHDMDIIHTGLARVVDIVRDMPLYYEFEVNGVKHIVTHSWLVDFHDNPIGTKAEFYANVISAEYSVWDREYSTKAWDYAENMPIIIHGHTPTLGEQDISDGKVITPLAKIKHVSNKNINVDCCAFYSPLRGGNMAAYRCEDGKEFYAYEDEEFYILADKYIESLKADSYNVTMNEYLFSILFYRQYAEVLSREDISSLKFQNQRAKEAFEHFRELYKECSPVEIAYEIKRQMNYVRNKVHDTVGRFWLENRNII